MYWHVPRCNAPTVSHVLALTRSEQQAIVLWDIRSAKEVRRLVGYNVCVGALAFSPDGKTLAAGDIEGTVRLWDAGTGGEVRCLKGHTSSLNSVAYSPDGKVLISCSVCDAV